MINLNGAQKERSGGGNTIKNYVGLGAVQLIAVNPNQAELENILGKKLEQAPDYSVRENPDGSKARPVSLWFKNSEDKLISERIYIGNKHITTKNGDKFKFINSVGQISYYATSAEDIANNPKVSKWYKTTGMRKLYEGEDILYTILQNLSRYDARVEGANWMEVMNSIGLTAEKIYDNQTDGLKQFVKYCQDNNNMLIVLHSVARREVDGNVRFNQRLVLREETMFRTTDGTVLEWMVNRLRDFNSQQLAAGYSITNQDFKVSSLQEYNPREFEVQDADMPSGTVSKFLDV